LQGGLTQGRTRRSFAYGLGSVFSRCFTISRLLTAKPISTVLALVLLALPRRGMAERLAAFRVRYSDAGAHSRSQFRPPRASSVKMRPGNSVKMRPLGKGASHEIVRRPKTFGVRRLDAAFLRPGLTGRQRRVYATFFPCRRDALGERPVFSARRAAPTKAASSRRTPKNTTRLTKS